MSKRPQEWDRTRNIPVRLAYREGATLLNNLTELPRFKVNLAQPCRYKCRASESARGNESANYVSSGQGWQCDIALR